MSTAEPSTPSPKSNSSNCLLRGLAALLALLLVISLPLALLMFDTGRVLFNPPLVKAILTDEVVHSEFLPLALEWFSDLRAQERVDSGEALTGETEPDIVLLMSFLERDDWKLIKAEVLTDEILTGWVSDTVDGFYAWIDSTERVPQITWEMQPFIERVNTEHGVNSIVIAFNEMDDCNQAQIDDFLARQAAVPPGTEVLYNLCKFPDPWREDQFNDYVNALDGVVENIPLKFNLTQEAGNLSEAEGQGPEAIKQQLRQIRWWMQWGWVIPAALLLLIAVLVVRSPETAGRWLGIPLAVAGVFTLLPVLGYRGLITSLLSFGPLSEVPAELRAEALRISLRLADEIFRPMLIQAVVLMLIGVALIVWLYVAQRKARQPA